MIPTSLPCSVTGTRRIRNALIPSEAEQKRKAGDRRDRVEGRIESLIQGRVAQPGTSAASSRSASGCVPCGLLDLICSVGRGAEIAPPTHGVQSPGEVFY